VSTEAVQVPVFELAAPAQSRRSCRTLGAMHSTLTLRGNLKLIALWCTVLAACVAAGLSGWWSVVGFFTLVGLAAGFLQGQAIRRQPSAFQAAASAVAVRKALLRSRPGFASVLLLWLAAVALLALLFVAKPPISLQAVFAAYASFALGRETLALPAVLSLTKSAPRLPQNGA